MHILIKFPSRGRPEKMKSTFMKYIEMANDPTRISFLISLDEDDSTVSKALQFVLKRLFKNVIIVVGPPSGKIGAVNRDMEKVGNYDIILLASDDMVPVEKGYDTFIREKMQEHYPDTDGVLFFNDGHQKEKLNTLCILGKKYYERFGYIYHPSYKTEYCDVEFMEVADKLGKQTYFENVIIEHQHPLWTLEAKDNTYRDNDKFINTDRDNYLQRKMNGFR